MSRLHGRHAVITGAASGIGEHTARLFVAEGASVVLADVDRARGEHLAAELGDQVRFVPVDVAVEGDVERAIEESQSAFGGFDCIFNNAGNPGSIGRIEDIDMELFDRTVAVHLRGVFLGIRAAARVMRPQGRGSIINTASVAGLRANYGGHDYSAAKAAIIHLTHTTANELGEDGVRVNAICPGGIATSIFGRGAGLDGDAAQSTVSVMEVALSDVAPIRRSGMPMDIAECALWLAGDGSSFVNGQAIAVDGGLVTGPTYRTSRARTESMVGLLAGVPGQGE
ncbi:MAG: glucose 1-dehydrogenase [Acidimicrobiales bacterium]|jgi:NAD(P)-dependent dehydrogenase (short-subunit alcohol dehydrogenase family)